MEVRRCFEDLSVARLGTEAPRSHYVPYGSLQEAMEGERELSERVQSLSGEWAFAYYSSADEIPDDLVGERTSLSPLDSIPVPSCWQLQGYGAPQYLNTRYPFPCDPPYVPAANPAGVYARDFSLPAEYGNTRHYLVFEGADSCVLLYINGRFAGYSQGPHLSSEFDITDYVHGGINRVAVLVLQWCAGSYLDCQDKWRMSGIFRDVLLLTRPNGHIRDVQLTPSVSPDYRTAGLHVAVDALCPEDVLLTLWSPDGEKLLTARPDTNGAADFTVEHPLLWSAESPVLYTLTAEYAGEFLSFRTGMRSVSTEGGVFSVNGRTVKLKGVNRHEFSTENGFCVSLKEMEQDLLLIKRHNLNAVRTSHYPDDPRFFDLCDRLGLYVLCEADLEAHGFLAAGRNDAAADPNFSALVTDRVSRTVLQNFNHPSIVIWSAGNESGWGFNLLNAVRTMKQLDPSRPVHYEGAAAAYTPQNGYPEGPDFISFMYPSPEFLREALSACEKDPRPILLCEYAHAMGNSGGGLADYQHVFASSPRFAGGFVWEWCDHALLQKGQSVAGKPVFCYGGDFGETMHDGNFCIDGLVSADRRPHPSLLELKAVSQPFCVEAVDLSAGEFCVTNLYDFIYLSRLECFFEVTRFGKSMQQGVVGTLPIPPKKSERVVVDYTVPDDGECTLRLIFRQLGDSPWAKDGFEVGSVEFVLPVQRAIPEPVAASKEREGLSLDKLSDRITVRGEAFSYTYSRRTGQLCSAKVHGRQLLRRPAEFRAFRAPTDNDRADVSAWQDAGLASLMPRAAEFTFDCGETAAIHSEIVLAAPGKSPAMSLHITRRIQQSGEIQFQCHAFVAEGLPPLPQFGLRFFLDKSLSAVTYYGLGPGENYCDRRQSAHTGFFSGNTEAYYTDYLRPQACGNRFAKLVSVGGDNGLTFAAGDGFEFSALPFSDEELLSASHSHLLPASRETVFTLNYRVSGVGSASCGPALPEKYRLSEKVFDWSFRFCPTALMDGPRLRLLLK